MSGCDGDQLFDHQVELVKMLEQKGVHVAGYFGVVYIYIYRSNKI